MKTDAIGIGERIKALRLAQNLTLKQLEAKAGVSATHLSEIERGLSSPTVGAIVRIAHALREEPALLVHERSGPRAAVVCRDERRTLAAAGAALELLGTPVEGAEMSLVEIVLAPHTEPFDPGPGCGEEFFLVLAGAIDLVLGEVNLALSEGDAIHFAAGATRTLRARNASRVLWVSAPARTF